MIFFVCESFFHCRGGLKVSIQWKAYLGQWALDIYERNLKVVELNPDLYRCSRDMEMEATDGLLWIDLRQIGLNEHARPVYTLQSLCANLTPQTPLNCCLNPNSKLI